MITYSLAKELKDAGFPQIKNPNIVTQGYYLNPLGLKTYSPLSKRAVFLPTLSELIEACGDRFKRLVRQSKTKYKAQGKGASREDGNRKSWFPDIHIIGSSPEEAVAKLWLELNKK
jgi:hypothetical protein